MGIGRHKDGEFDLIVSFRFRPSVDEYWQWASSFHQGSRLLFEATEGQLRIDRVFVALDSAGSSEADAWLHEAPGDSHSPRLGLTEPDHKMTLRADERFKPYVITHEFGHYALGLHDEYVGNPVVRACTGNPSTGACIMEFAWNEGDHWVGGVLNPGAVRRFCTAEGPTAHNALTESAQTEPCWSTIVGEFPDLSPPSGAPFADPGTIDFQWILLYPTPRYVLLLDKSGSMAGAKFEAARLGAWYWLRYQTRVDEFFSAIAFDSETEVALPLTRLPEEADLSPLIDRILNLTPGGNVDLGNGLQEALDQITSQTGRAATQVVLLFSDGQHDGGTSPADLVEPIVENGIRLYTIGFGPDANQERLESLASATGGRFWHIEPSGDVDDVLLVLSKLMEYSGEIRDGAGIVTTTPELLAEPPLDGDSDADARIEADYDESHAADIAGWQPTEIATAGGYDHTVYIEKGSQRATFTLAHEPRAVVRLFVQRPDGSIVNPREARREQRRGAPFVFYTIDRPEKGNWTMRVARGQARGRLPFVLAAFSDNPQVNLSLRGDRKVYEVGDTVHFEVTASSGAPLTNLPPPVIRPDPGFDAKSRQGTRSLPLTDEHETGVYTAEFRPPGPGTYSFVLEVDAGEHAYPDTDERVSEHRTGQRAAPRFLRTQRFQVRVRRRVGLLGRALRWLGLTPRGRDPW